MTTLREAAQIVVNDWLHQWAKGDFDAEKFDERIEALRAALAQPEQKPVAQVQVAEDYYPHVVFLDGVDTTSLDQKFLYTAPPQRERIMCGCGDQIMPDDGAECGTCVTARNTVQREWQGLTDDEIKVLDCTTINASDWNEYEVYKPSVKEFARAIEAKLRGKNQ